MTVEKTTEETQKTETEKDWRNEPGAIAQVRQINELRAQLDAMNAKLKSKEDETAAKAREAEEARLKAAGDFDSLRARLEAEYKAKESAAQAAIRKARIEALSASIGDEWRRKGVIADAMSAPEETDLDEYFNILKGSHPDLFQQSAIKQSNSLPNGGRVADPGMGKLSDEQLDAMIKSSDKEERSRAIAYRRALFAKTGKTRQE